MSSISVREVQRKRTGARRCPLLGGICDYQGMLISACSHWDVCTKLAKEWAEKSADSSSPGSNPGGVGAAPEGSLVESTGVGFPQAHTSTPNADPAVHSHYWPTRNSPCVCGASYYAPKADTGRVYRATVGFNPGQEGDLVSLKPSWYADNGYETAVFPTKESAVEFAWKRWRVPAEQVRVLSL